MRAGSKISKNSVQIKAKGYSLLFRKVHGWEKVKSSQNKNYNKVGKKNESES
jgi:hypothetical protein